MKQMVRSFDTSPHRLLVLVADTDEDLEDLVKRAVAKGWDASIPSGREPETGLPSAWLTKLASVQDQKL